MNSNYNWGPNDVKYKRMTYFGLFEGARNIDA